MLFPVNTNKQNNIYDEQGELPMIYSLEYKMMVQVASQLKYSGKFQAEVTPRSLLKEGGEVFLEVQQGKIISCAILNKSGQVIYQNDEAQRHLSTFGILEWKLMPAKVVHPPQVSPNTPPPPSIRSDFPRSHTPPPQSMKDGSPLFHHSYTTPPPQSAGDSLFYPRRRDIAEREVNSWPALERSVYLLCDGQHSIADIARILSRSLLTIEQIVHTLQWSGALVNV